MDNHTRNKSRYFGASNDELARKHSSRFSALSRIQLRSSLKPALKLPWGGTSTPPKRVRISDVVEVEPGSWSGDGYVDEPSPSKQPAQPPKLLRQDDLMTLFRYFSNRNDRFKQMSLIDAVRAGKEHLSAQECRWLLMSSAAFSEFIHSCDNLLTQNLTDPICRSVFQTYVLCTCPNHC